MNLFTYIDWQSIFLRETPILEIFLRGSITYLGLFLLLRFVLKRESGIVGIIDNGRGFDIPTEWLELARQGHLGLVGIRERVEAIGGELTIKSTQGEGTQVKLTVPIS